MITFVFLENNVFFVTETLKIKILLLNMYITQKAKHISTLFDNMAEGYSFEHIVR